MMLAILLLLGVPITAAAYRLQGSHKWKELTGLGGAMSAVFFALVCMAVVAAAQAWMGRVTWYWLVGIGCGLACTVSSFEAIDAGRKDGTPLKDAFMNLLRGIVMALPCGVVAYFTGHPWWLWIAFALMVPLGYELGARVPSKVPDAEQGPPMAEIVIGAAFGAVLVVSAVILTG